MGLPSVQFVLGQGGIGRALPSSDHISGLAYYNSVTGTYPTGFSATDKVKKVLSLNQAEGLGIIEGSANFGVLHYHVKEFFSKHSKGVLYIGVYDLPTTFTFDEIDEMRRESEGSIRQLGIWTNKTFDSADLATIQGKIYSESNAYTAYGEYEPLEVVYSADMTAVTDLTNLDDLRALNAPNVSVEIGQDNGKEGKALFTSSTKSIGSLGAVLGTISFANVHEDIGWVEKFNILNSREFNEIGFSNGSSYKSVSKNLLDNIHDKGYIFLRKHTGYSGTYFNRYNTSISITSDYAYGANNRVIGKAIRQTYFYSVPSINRPLYLTAEGKLNEDTLAFLNNTANKGLLEMKKAGEISDGTAVIDPDQDVQSDNQVDITLEIIQVGTAETITYKIGFTTQLSSN